MHSEYFEIYKSKLSSALNDNDSSENLSIQYPFLLVKGDISGIQEFVFRVKSDGASRSLKGRSFYVQALAEICVQYLLDACSLTGNKLLYQGGGDFYLIMPPDDAEEHLRSAREVIDQALLEDELSLLLSWVKVDDDEDFGQWIKKLNSQINRAKQQKYTSLSYDDVFAPYLLQNLGKVKWDWFTKNLADLSTIGFKVSPCQEQEGIDDDKVVKLGYAYQLERKETTILFNKPDQSLFRFVVKQLPTWTDELLNDSKTAINHYKQIKQGSEKYRAPEKDELIDFDHLALLAEARTGSDNLSVLKMDVDNLGATVANLKHANQFQHFAEALSYFFGMHVEDLLDRDFDSNSQYGDNIYVIFSGGDDCFMVGGWDAVLSFAQLIRTEFDKFTENRLTLSAAYLIISPNFPVVRFANLAEEALSQAKYYQTEKNRINILGEVFQWEEFYCLLEIRDSLVKLINPEEISRKESRAILQKINSSTRGFKGLIKNSGKGKLDFVKLWRFRYYLRDMKTENYSEREKLITIYESMIMRNMLNEQKIENLMLLPVAVRLAELSTRKTLTYEA